jgi:hypothetical protein
LNSLQRLYLHGKSWCRGQFPTKESSLWPNVTKAEDIAYHYAQLIHTRCPRLQHIRIQNWAWRICFVADTSACEEQQKELVALDTDEILSIDLFAIQNTPNQTGLHGPEEPREIEEHDFEELHAMDDEEWDTLEGPGSFAAWMRDQEDSELDY